MATTKNAGSRNRKTQQKKGAAQGNTQLEKFLVDSLRNIYWAEKHLMKALPKMQKATTTEELQEAIGEHITQTKKHVSRLEQVFNLLGKRAQAKKCDGMEGLIKEDET